MFSLAARAPHGTSVQRNIAALDSNTTAQSHGFHQVRSTIRPDRSTVVLPYCSQAKRQKGKAKGTKSKAPAKHRTARREQRKAEAEAWVPPEERYPTLKIEDEDDANRFFIFVRKTGDDTWLPLGDITVDAEASPDLAITQRLAGLNEFAQRKFVTLSLLQGRRLEYCFRQLRGRLKDGDRGFGMTPLEEAAKEGLASDVVPANLKLLYEDMNKFKQTKEQMLAAAMANVNAQNVDGGGSITTKGI